MLVYAHRGANVELPENTLEAFERAVELGADALETDVHTTSDDEVVVHHDPTGERTASDHRAIASLKLADVRRWNLGFGFRLPSGEGLVNARYRVPTFSELLESFPDKRINVDIKPRSIATARRVMAVVARHRAEERVLLTSFWDMVVSAVRAHGYRGPTGLARLEVLRALAAPPFTPRWLLPAGSRIQIPTRAGGLRLDSRSVVRRLQNLGYAVDFWVVNDAEEARRARAAGADGVMTDDPRAVVAALRA
jgi:glycerophosphoryl diester phosphodiesterase